MIEFFWLVTFSHTAGTVTRDSQKHWKKIDYLCTGIINMPVYFPEFNYACVDSWNGFEHSECAKHWTLSAFAHLEIQHKDGHSCVKKNKRQTVCLQIKMQMPARLNIYLIVRVALHETEGKARKMMRLAESLCRKFILVGSFSVWYKEKNWQVSA